jgi:hypothetical protein
VRQFLSSIDKIELDIRNHLKSLKHTAAQYESDKQLLDYWGDLGYPDKILYGNRALNLYEIKPQGFRPDSFWL